MKTSVPSIAPTETILQIHTVKVDGGCNVPVLIKVVGDSSERRPRHRLDAFHLGVPKSCGSLFYIQAAGAAASEACLQGHFGRNEKASNRFEGLFQ
jgi:hypothetical protein